MSEKETGQIERIAEWNNKLDSNLIKPGIYYFTPSGKMIPHNCSLQEIERLQATIDKQSARIELLKEDMAEHEDTVKENQRLQAELAESRRGEEIIGGKYDDLLNEAAALALRVKKLEAALEMAANQIRRCDYTPARSTLLEALADSDKTADDTVYFGAVAAIRALAAAPEQGDSNV